MSSLQAQVNIEEPVEVPREPEVSRTNIENEAGKPPPTQATGPKEANKNLLHSLFKFKVGAPLGKYIASKMGQKKETQTLAQVLTVLKETIRGEGMFDESNPSIILCDPSLERALSMKALHVTEIRDLVLNQLEKISDPSLTNTATFSSPPSLNNSQSQVLGRSMSIPAGNISPPAITTTVNSQPSVSPNTQPSIPPTSQPSTLPLRAHPSAPPSSVEPVSGQSTMTARERSCAPRPNVISSHVYNNPSARFSLKPDFLSVIRSIPGVDPHQILFSYEQVTLLLSKYILAKKLTLFDQRNIKVALVENDPLGKAFNVKAFHRCQVTNLLRSQLIQVEEEPTNCGVSSTTPDPGTPGTPATVQVPPFPVLQKSQSMPAHASYTVQQLETSRLPSTSEGVVRKRSLSQEAPEQVAKRSRDHGHTQYAVAVVRKANDSEESETETICSAQGYETAAADREETIVVERLDSKEDEEGFSTSDTDMEDDKSDQFSRTALVYSAPFLEYEPESSSEDEKRPNIAGGGADSDSEKDTDIEDVMVVAVMAKAMGCDSDYLGDSEEEDVAPGEKELDVVDPELEERDNWRCAQCDTPNTPLIRYCGKCWNIRKGWMPDRPKPRRKVRPTLEARAKKTLPALDRSLSDPGQGQDEADSVLPSQMSVSDDEKSKDCVPDSQSTDSGISSAGSQESLAELEVGSSQDAFSESGTSGSNKCDDALSVSSQDLGSEASLGGRKGKSVQSLCMFCNVRPKDASFIHGRLGHQVCCQQCAKKVFNKTGRCPICRRKIEKIIKNVIQ